MIKVWSSWQEIASEHGHRWMLLLRAVETQRSVSGSYIRNLHKYKRHALDIEHITQILKDSFESHSKELKRGDIFLPEHLKGKEFTRTVFPPVIATLAASLGLKLESEYCNRFAAPCGIDRPQRVDFALMKSDGVPSIFLEVESLDRSQLYLFTDAQFQLKNNDNKLWYYHGTLATYYMAKAPVPRYFVFLLTLPDRRVGRYQLWDIHKEYQLFHPDLQNVVFANPYQFYDRQIKARARAFANSQWYFPNDTGYWAEQEWGSSQQICELVFITCTIDALVLSRGTDLFHPSKEKRFEIAWPNR